jgi:hypothetical protein
LLDRFLAGYLRDGEFRRIPNLQISVWIAQSGESSNAALAARRRDFGLVPSPDLADAMKDADAIIAAPAADQVAVAANLLTRVMEQAPSGARCFIYGCLAVDVLRAQQFVSLADSRQLTVASGTSVATALRLPDVDVVDGTPLTEALIVVQGMAPAAELSGFEGLLPIIARRPGGETGLKAVRYVIGRQFWRVVAERSWLWPLLAAAISRSNTAQGDGVRDGRTQDLVGKGLVKKLAHNPRGWILEHRDGLRSAILVLDGVVADANFAVRARDGAMISAQWYRPPGPNRCEFDSLVGVLEDFFRTARRPWPLERSVAIAKFLEQMAAASP